ncbi:MAG: hypothetical protein IJ242_05775 [Clostridia bacterium]|nr:hypothetical protein [Clostridia bacterium]
MKKSDATNDMDAKPHSYRLCAIWRNQRCTRSMGEDTDSGVISLPLSRRTWVCLT